MRYYFHLVLIMAGRITVVMAALALLGCVESLHLSECQVAARTESGLVCGRLRQAADGRGYASFRGIPYAKQPLGKLRFQELQPAEPFNGIFDATESGPVCSQIDVIFGPLLQPRAMGEDCIRINIHVPIEALPDLYDEGTRPLLPILAWIHGGAFAYGSGDADFHGPEYLMTKGVILVTFNYRLNVLGFLTLNSNSIPGNNGLRDAVTALRWLQRNARFFGGDPQQVTLGGQSAGAVMAHLLSISPAVNGLFRSVMALSGTAIANFYSYSPNYSNFLSKVFLLAMGMNIFEDPEVIHKELIAAPMEKLLAANKLILDQVGLLAFAPVIETPQINFTTIVPRDPEYLLNEGSGTSYPLLLGFTDNECQTFVVRLREVDIETKMKLLSFMTVPMNLLFAADPLTIPILTLKVFGEYFNNTSITLKKFLPICADAYFKYPVLRLTEKRLATGKQPTYIYEFRYHGENSVLKGTQGIDFSGAGHLEDITYFFRVNGVLGQQRGNELMYPYPDSRMKEWMTSFVANFVSTGEPAPPLNWQEDSHWPQSDHSLGYQRIEVPMFYNYGPPSPYLKQQKRFFDKLYRIGRGR